MQPLALFFMHHTTSRVLGENSLIFFNNQASLQQLRHYQRQEDPLKWIDRFYISRSYLAWFCLWNTLSPVSLGLLQVYHKRVIAQVSLVFVRVFFIYIERGYLWEKFWGIEALRTSVEKFEVISKFFVIAEVKLADWWLLNMVGSETVLAGLKAK